MRLFLQDGPARLQILSRAHVREFRDVGAARDFLRPILANAGNRAAARRVLGHAHSWSDGELLEHLAQRVVHDGLQIISCADSYLASLQGTFTEAAAAAAGGASSAATAAGAGAGATSSAAATTPLQDEEAAQQDRAAAATTEETHWIEVELVDEDGAPMANESYFVELPDGTTRSGRTDGQGRARIENIDPGTAKISFPDRDKATYTPGGGGP